MARIEGRPKIDLEVALIINESEARALDALVGYGTDSFLKAFYEKLGEAYMKQHESGLRSFFAAVKENIPFLLAKLDESKSVFIGKPK